MTTLTSGFGTDREVKPLPIKTTMDTGKIFYHISYYPYSYYSGYKSKCKVFLLERASVYSAYLKEVPAIIEFSQEHYGKVQTLKIDTEKLALPEWAEKPTLRGCIRFYEPENPAVVLNGIRLVEYVPPKNSTEN